MSLLDTASLIVTPNGYKEGKLFSVIPSDGSGDMSVTRATTATRVNSAGLVELVPYNLLKYSQDFTNGDWVKLGTAFTVTGNTTTAPDGTLTADTLNVSNNDNILYQSNSSGYSFTGNTYTFSIYAKGTGTFDMRIRLNSSTTTSQVKTLTNEWQRFDVSVTNSASVTSVESYLVLNTSSTYIVWGAQLVEGSTAKDYQKTETRLNIPRLDYSNGTCPSILVEPARTNLNLFSEQFDNGAYSSGGGAGSGATFTTNYGIAPDGNQTADRVQITRGSNYWERYQRGTTTIGKVYTLSFWGKAVTGTPTLYTAWNTAYQNPVTFTNEWVRYTYTYTAAGTSTGFNLITWVNLAGTSATADVMVWGIQLEQGSYATSYIPTSSTIITRTPDSGTTNLSSSILNSSEGVLFLDYQPLNTLDSFPVDFQLQYNGDNLTNGVTIYQAGNIPSVTVRSGGSTIFAESLTATTTGTRNKIAIAYKQNDYAVYQNGVLIASQSSGVAPAALNQIRISDGLRHFSINAAALWKTRLTNDQLEALTGTGFNTYAEMAEYYNYILQ